MYLVLPSFRGSSEIFPDSTRFHRGNPEVGSTFDEEYRVLLGFTGFLRDFWGFFFRRLPSWVDRAGEFRCVAANFFSFLFPPPPPLPKPFKGKKEKKSGRRRHGNAAQVTNRPVFATNVSLVRVTQHRHHRKTKQNKKKLDAVDVAPFPLGFPVIYRVSLECDRFLSVSTEFDWVFIDFHGFYWV